MDVAKQDTAQNMIQQTAAMVDQASDEDFEDQQQYLTFLMQGEEYGVDILNVQEIRGWGNVAPIPNAPNRKSVV